MQPARSLRLGMHVPLGPSLVKTVSCGLPCLQFYLTERSPPFSLDDLRLTRHHCDTKQVSFYLHCPLGANLAHCEGHMCAHHTTAVQKQLNTIQGLPGACVLHIGKTDGDRTTGIRQVAAKLNELKVPRVTTTFRQNCGQLLMECAAGQAKELGSTWEEMRLLFEGLDTTSGIGFCLDTQHAFAAGLTTLSSEASLDKLWANVQDIGRPISLIHLNDSKVPFGTHVDRHANLRQGYIWHQDATGLQCLLRRCRDEGIDMVLETKNPVGDLKWVAENFTEG